MAPESRSRFYATAFITFGFGTAIALAGCSASTDLTVAPEAAATSKDASSSDGQTAEWDFAITSPKAKLTSTNEGISKLRLKRINETITAINTSDISQSQVVHPAYLQANWSGLFGARKPSSAITFAGSKGAHSYALTVTDPVYHADSDAMDFTVNWAGKPPAPAPEVVSLFIDASAPANLPGAPQMAQLSERLNKSIPGQSPARQPSAGQFVIDQNFLNNTKAFFTYAVTDVDDATANLSGEALPSEDNLQIENVTIENGDLADFNVGSLNTQQTNIIGSSLASAILGANNGQPNLQSDMVIMNSYLPSATLNEMMLVSSTIATNNATGATLNQLSATDSALTNNGLAQSTWQNPRFTSSAVIGNDISQSTMNSPTFNKTTVSSNDFGETALNSPAYENSVLTDNSFDKATINNPTYTSTIDSGGQYTSAQVNNFTSNSSSFEGSNFAGATLTGGIHTNSSFENVNFSGRLINVVFDGGRMGGYTPTKAGQIAGVHFDYGTIEGGKFGTAGNPISFKVQGSGDAAVSYASFRGTTFKLGPNGELVEFNGNVANLDMTRATGYENIDPRNATGWDQVYGLPADVRAAFVRGEMYVPPQPADPGLGQGNGAQGPGQGQAGDAGNDGGAGNGQADSQQNDDDSNGVGSGSDGAGGNADGGGDSGGGGAGGGTAPDADGGAGPDTGPDAGEGVD